MEEITTTVLQSGPLALEFASEMHQQATKSNANEDVQGTGKYRIAHVDFEYTTGDNDRPIIDRVDAESSSEKSTTDLPQEIVYLDDIEEFPSPLNGESGKTKVRNIFHKITSTLLN
ncbi:hypothetical protein L2E82_27920 [Cichorium intybus]|uniref:Uncharacterized protein n=1 Tax=Cichorium intybus TaxID=13427 RepID=A0ACB9CUH2_CICIN|nr:hypothetical protein L2E82_27920 [Cichorium intybus]